MPKPSRFTQRDSYRAVSRFTFDKSRLSYYLTAFISGLISLALELAASRLLEPFFGTSNLVWAAIIGLILLFLAIGYALGGAWADRDPNPATLYTLITVAGITIAAIPFVARPVLQLAARGFAAWDAGQIVATFAAVLALFTVPVTLLACVSPFIIRLALTDVQLSGVTSGRIYAISTTGSFLGTFLPTLWLIPTLGTRRTFLLLALLAVVTGMFGLWHTERRRFWIFIWAPLAILALYFLRPRTIKPQTGLLYEAESAYNFIQVVEKADGTRYLLLNEGQGIHSIWKPGNAYLTGGTWDYFLIAPFFNPPPHPPAAVQRLLVIGLAAGTIPTQYTAVYGPIPIDGVEIDPAIVDVGRTYFEMTMPNLNTITADGRAYVRQTDTAYDVIAVDAYRLPYIPWHLTTVEFFQELRAHLTDTGVVAINVGHTPGDWRLVEAMIATMRHVYPSVHTIAVPDTLNAIVVATMQESTAENLAHNLDTLTDPTLRTVAQRALDNLRPIQPSDMVFTDDRTPIEHLTNVLAVRYILGIE